MKRTMIVTVVAAACLALAGCKKPPAPQAVEIEAAARPADELMPVPPAGEASAGTRTAEGPTATPETASPPTKTTVSGSGEKLYTVAKGDTLMSIARKFYGDARRYKDIAKANNITDPNKISIGQVLKIPE